MNNLKLIISSICLSILFLSTNTAKAQGINIQSGASITMIGAPSIVVNNGNLVNNGTYTKGTETFTFTGNTAKTISGASNTRIYNLVINSTGGITTQVGLLTNNNLTVESGSTFTVAPLKNITIMGSFVNNAGTSGVVIKSDATGTASLIHYSTDVQATVERFVTGNAWHLMFASLSAIPTAIYTTEGTDKNYNLYSYDESKPDYWNASSTYGITGWTAEYLNINLPTSNGYIFNRFGLTDKIYSQTGGSLFVGQKDFTVNYNKSTEPIENDVTQDWPYFDGWNIIGNPYASAIDWDLLINDDIEAGVYFYSEDNYRYYVYGDTLSKWNVGITVNGGSNYIPAGQAFFVKVKNTGITHSAIVSITESARLHNPQTFYKKSSLPAPNILRLKISQGNITDETVIRTVPEANESYDGNYDANKMFSWNKMRPQVYSLNANKNELFAINAMPEFQEYKVVPFGIYTGISGQYTINFTNNSFDGYHIWLEDKLLGTKQNITTNKNYTFNQGIENNTDRFLLHFGINHAPEASQIPNQSLYVKDNFDLLVPENTFTDADSSDVLTFSAGLSNGDPLPAWLSFDTSKRRFYGLPDKAQTVEISVLAKDRFGEIAKSTFLIEVIRINHAPIAAAIPNQYAYINSYFNFYIPANTFIDIDLGDKLSSTALLSNGDALPEWLSFDPIIGRFYGLPDKAQTIEVAVTVVDLFGESVNTIFSIEVLESALYAETQDKYSLVVYPNPSSGIFNIKTGSLLNSQIIIRDIMGRIVLKSVLSSKIETIDLTKSARGMYFIEIESDKGIVIKKIEIQ